MATFISILDKIGAVTKDIFKVAVPIAGAVEPIVDIAFPEIAPLYNVTVTLVMNAEAAASAAGATGAGPQKLALVLASLLPYATAEAANLGIKAPTQAQLTGWVNAIVAALNSLEATPIGVP